MAKRTILLLIAAMLFCSLSKTSLALEEVCSKPSPKNKNLVAKILCGSTGKGGINYNYCQIQMRQGEDWKLVENVQPGTGKIFSWRTHTCTNDTQWSSDGKYFAYWYVQENHKVYRGETSSIKIYDTASKKLMTFNESKAGHPYPLKYFDKSCTKKKCENDAKKDGPFFSFDIKDGTVTFNVIYISENPKPSDLSSQESCFLNEKIERITFDLKKQKVKSRKSMYIKMGCLGFFYG